MYDPALKRPRPSHYHGETVRVIFVIAAILVFLTQYVGTKLPLSTGFTMVLIVTLVVAAGITNPVQRWIHWANTGISILGLLIFGGLALSKFGTNGGVVSDKGLIAILAILFVGSLYFSTRTLRGFMVPHVDQGIEERVSLEPYD